MRRGWRLDSIAMTVALTVIVAMGLGAALQRVVNAGLEYAGFEPLQIPGDFRTRFSAAFFPAIVVSLTEALDTVPNTQRPRSSPPRAFPRSASIFAMRRCTISSNSDDAEAIRLRHQIRFSSRRRA